jgi:hypothetical protein
MRILVETQSVDFRKGIDGLAAIRRKQLEQEPMTGVNVNRCFVAWRASSEVQELRLTAAKSL